MKLEFLGIGAQKCASTWIGAVLADHPDVVMPETAPLDFFSYRFENGYRWYERQFPAHGSGRYFGEMSQSYFHEPAVIDRVWVYAPDVKIVVSLRDPVERALSQHRHLVRLGIVERENLEFETSLETNPTYVEQGRYFTHLSRWFDRFGSQRVMVVLMEDVIDDPESVASKLYRFVGVDERHRPVNLNRVRNASYVTRYGRLERAVRGLSGRIAALGGGKAWGALGATGLRSAYRKFNRRPSASIIPTPTQVTIQKLRETFLPEVAALSRLIDRDLSHWLR
jgi:hypothetical protein